MKEEHIESATSVPGDDEEIRQQESPSNSAGVMLSAAQQVKQSAVAVGNSFEVLAHF